MHYYNRQLLYDLLQLITFICTVAKNCFKSTIPIHNFCMHHLILQLLLHCYKWNIVCNSGTCNFFHCYDNCWFILALLQLTTFVCPISRSNFCMHHCYSQLLYVLLSIANCLCTTTIQDTFCDTTENAFAAILQLTTFHTLSCLLTFVLHYCNWQLFLCTIVIDNCSMLYSNCEIFYVAKTTSRSSVAAKNVKHDNKMF